MAGVMHYLFSIVWILTLVSMIVFRNKAIVFERDKGFKVYIEEEGVQMKRGTRPTRRQKEFLSQRRLDPDNWLIVKDRNEYIDIVNKGSSKVRRVLK